MASWPRVGRGHNAGYREGRIPVIELARAQAGQEVDVRGAADYVLYKAQVDELAKRRELKGLDLEWYRLRVSKMKNALTLPLRQKARDWQRILIREKALLSKLERAANRSPQLLATSS